MQYRKDRYGNEISILGFGCMRLSRKDGHVDMEKAVSEIRAAYEAGINYYDTAWSYGDNEAVMGEIFGRLGIRDSIFIATKLPQYRVTKTEDFERYFSEELERLQTDHVDYYLMHMMNDALSYRRLKDLGLEEWLREKQEKGQIRQVGFSYHGNPDCFAELLDERDWDLCQIQYNYMDENSQAGKTGLRYAAKKGLPVIIMEPLRGGKLAQLPAEAQKLLDSYPVKRSPAAWSFSWLWDQPEVTCVLSGMNSMEMLTENIRTAGEAKTGMLTDEDRALLAGVLQEIGKKMKVGCTGCRYCMPCPRGVNIPGIFKTYNDYYSMSRFHALREYFMCNHLRREKTGLTNCIGCHACEKKCPQGIAIAQELKNAGRVLEAAPMRLIYKGSGLIMKY